VLNGRAGAALFITGSLVAGALSFLLIFQHHLAAIPRDNYAARDDALITLSHARNLVEYGFIGVAPSGERIEGFSAPLQFWLAAALYKLTPFDYAPFFRWQTLVGTCVLGALAALMFAGPFRAPTSGRLALLAGALILVPWILASSRAFLLWHSSGMENVYKVALLAATLAALDWMLRANRLAWWAAPIVLLASLTRIDALLPVGMLLAAFVLLWWLRQRNFAALRFVFWVLAPWIVYMLWRWWYFGQWESNTAIGQNISVGARLAHIVNTPAEAWHEHLAWLSATGRALQVFQLAWLPLPILLARGNATVTARVVLIGAGVSAAILQFTFFGPSRMDPDRTVTEVAMYAAFAVPFALAGLHHLPVMSAVAGIAIMAASAAIASARAPDRTEIGWGAAEWTANLFETLAREHDLPRPLVSNPDLGGVSWRKQFNLVDSGLLGSAVMPRVERPVVYLAEVAKPDFIELHGAWSCRYHPLFSNETFLREYHALRSERDSWLDENCPLAPGARSGLWVRLAVMKGSGSRERAFIETLRADLSAARVSAEFNACRTPSQDAGCSYVARTLFRFVPELKAAGLLEDVATILERDGDDPSGSALLTSSLEPGWWRRRISAFEPVSVTPAQLSLFTLLDGTKASQAVISLRDPFDFGWQIETDAPELVAVTPTQGVGSASINLKARATTRPIDRQVSVRVYGADRAAPARVLTVRFRTIADLPKSQPFGAIDTQPETLSPTSQGVLVAGWALDAFDMRHVRVYAEENGMLHPMGEALRGGARADLTQLFPTAHDLYNAAWSFHVTSSAIAARARPLTLRIYAEASDGRVTDLGTRVIP
jgi:hypothetical protein